MKTKRANELILDPKTIANERTPGNKPGILTWMIPAPWRKTPLRVWANRDTIIYGGRITCLGVEIPDDNETRRITYTNKLARHHVIEGCRVPDALGFLEIPLPRLDRVQHRPGGLCIMDASRQGRMVEWVGEEEKLMVRQHSLLMIKRAHGVKIQDLAGAIANTVTPTLLLFRKISGSHRVVAAMAAVSSDTNKEKS